MQFTTLNGRPRDVPTAPYAVDWARKVSGPQKAVKDFLRPYWEHGVVLEEFRIPGSKLRVDLLRLDGARGVMVEVSPESSHSFNAFFHGSLSGFKASLKRDISKARWAELNDLVYCEIVESDFPLTVAAFERQGVIL